MISLASWGHELAPPVRHRTSVPLPAANWYLDAEKMGNCFRAGHTEHPEGQEEQQGHDVSVPTVQWAEHRWHPEIRRDRWA